MPVNPDPTLGGVIPSNPGNGIRGWNQRYWKQRGYSIRKRYFRQGADAVIMMQESRHLTAVCEFLASDFNNSSVQSFRENNIWPTAEVVTVAAGGGNLEAFTYSGDWRIEEIDFAFDDTPICVCTVELMLKEEPESSTWDEF